MHSSIAWWNTSLSPVRAADRATPETREIAAGVIDHLALEMGADLICLGEVGEADIEFLRSRPQLAHYTIYEGLSETGRSSFDICVLFRKNIHLLEKRVLVGLDGRSVLKLGQQIDFALADNETVLHLFVSHWPSRMFCGENDPNRDQLGLLLRDEVMKAVGPDHAGHAIVLGDFNDEPFSRSLEMQLKAIRDRDLAARQRHLLYNPFWKLMAPPNLVNGNTDGVSWTGGSYFYNRTSRTKWHTFDQIIFSSAFLGNSRWSLVDETVQVLNYPPYTSVVMNRTSKFDHMPVIATIARKENHG